MPSVICSHVVDAGVGRGVHLQHVDVARFHDGAAMHALFGEVDRGPAGAVGQQVVEPARQDARRRRLAHAAHAGEDPGLRNAARRERVAQRAHHRVLADQVVEVLRAVFPGQHAIGRLLGGWRAGGRGAELAARMYWRSVRCSRREAGQPGLVGRVGERRHGVESGLVVHRALSSRPGRMSGGARRSEFVLQTGGRLDRDPPDSR